MSRQATTSHFHKSKTLDNRYMLGDEIGKGAYGRVYKGLDLDNGDFVAVKQVSLENISQEDLNVIMVACGKRAGAFTCLLDETGRYDSPEFVSVDLKPDFKVSSLLEVLTLLDTHFELMP